MKKIRASHRDWYRSCLRDERPLAMFDFAVAGRCFGLPCSCTIEPGGVYLGLISADCLTTMIFLLTCFLASDYFSFQV